ncbi:copper homeostasis protein CutC [Faecalimonas sp.]
MKKVLECCVDSVESAIAAKEGGADRIELCSGLVIGGLSPSIALFKKIKEVVDIPIRPLLRTRFGDFCYTTYEHEILKEEVKIFRQLGAEGIVIGSLTSEGRLDLQQMSELMEEAGEMRVTLHRAFDMCKNPIETLEQAKKLGIDTILTSGQKNCAKEGVELLKQLVENSENQIEILVGGGVDAKTIPMLYEKANTTSYHMSGKISLESQMKYRNANVNMGVASVSEYEIWRTSKERIQEARSALDSL